MTQENIRSGFLKQASLYGISPKVADGMFNDINPPAPQQYSVQQYMGQTPRREFTPDEQQTIDRHKGSLMPKIFQSLADSPAVKMYNPGVDATIGGGLGALAGGALGGLTEGSNGNGSHALIGALLGGGLGGLAGYKRREAKNNDIEEIMRHSPPNSTLRSYFADPLIQKNQDRSHEKLLAQMLNNR